MSTRTALLGVLLSLTFASSAQATMPLGFQQEGMTPARCDQMADLGSRWARIMIQPERWTEKRSQYIATVQRCQQHGIRVIAALTYWKTRPTAQQVASFAAVAARDLGPWVDVWSTINEPNHPSFSVAYNPACTTTWHRIITRRVVRYKRDKHGAYKRIKRKAGGYRYKHVGRRHGHYRKVRRTKRTTQAFTTRQPELRCLAAASRRAHDMATAQIVRFDPTARFIVGDTAGPGSEFLTEFYAMGSGRPRGDIFAIHYAPPNKAVKALASKHGLKVWVTEWGLPAAEQGNLTATLSAFEKAGVSLLIYYNGLDWDGNWKNLKLTPAALEAAEDWNN